MNSSSVASLTRHISIPEEKLVSLLGAQNGTNHTTKGKVSQDRHFFRYQQGDEHCFVSNLLCLIENGTLRFGSLWCTAGFTDLACVFVAIWPWLTGTVHRPRQYTCTMPPFTNRCRIAATAMEWVHLLPQQLRRWHAALLIVAGESSPQQCKVCMGVSKQVTHPARREFHVRP